MQSSNVLAKTDILGDQLNTQMSKNMVQLNIVQLISKLPLTDFITCCVDKVYDVLILDGGSRDGQEEAVNQGWVNLLGQYHDARKDEKTTQNIEIRSRIMHLRIRATIIGLLLDTVNMFYSKTLIDSIKKFDSEFEQFEFSEETIEQDLIFISNIEINNKIEYESALVELQEFEEKIGIKDKDGNYIEKSKLTEQVFYDYVMAYNEVFKTSHSVDRLNTLEYARMCYRYEKYIESVNLKNKENA